MTDMDDLTIEINGQKITADMAAWDAVAEQIRARHAADREAWEQQQRAAGQVWYALYWRHWSVYADEFFSFDSARGFLESASENGDIGGHAIRLPSGDYVDTSGARVTAEEADRWEREVHDRPWAAQQQERPE